MTKPETIIYRSGLPTPDFPGVVPTNGKNGKGLLTPDYGGVSPEWRWDSTNGNYIPADHIDPMETK